jgi:hypothetical protein
VIRDILLIGKKCTILPFNGRPNSFVIKSTVVLGKGSPPEERDYMISTTSDQELKEWIEAIINNIDTSKSLQHFSEASLSKTEEQTLP